MCETAIMISFMMSSNDLRQRPLLAMTISLRLTFERCPTERRFPGCVHRYVRTNKIPILLFEDKEIGCDMRQGHNTRQWHKS